MSVSNDTIEREKVRCEWHRISIHFKTGIDLDALTRAAEPTAELREEGLPPAFAGAPDDLDHRLLHWGWTCSDAYGDYRRNPIPRLMGVYWDATYAEDDAILLPRLAPFIKDGSRAFFTPNNAYSAKGWDFDGTTATVRDAEIEWVFS